MEERTSMRAKTGVDTTHTAPGPASATPVPDPVSTGPVGGPVVAKPKRNGHLYQIDLVRLVTFAAVIFDHVILGLMSATAVVAGGVGLLCRYTRYSFFALTGFVQTYQYRDRELKPVDYWRRRYKLIGLPFPGVEPVLLGLRATGAAASTRSPTSSTVGTASVSPSRASPTT